MHSNSPQATKTAAACFLRQSIAMAAFVRQVSGPQLRAAAAAAVLLLALHRPASAQQYLWAKAFGNTGASDSAYANAVAVDDHDNVVLGGQFQGTVDFGKGALRASGGPDGFIARYSIAGIASWSVHLGGAGSSTNIGSVAVDAAGDVYALGSFTGTISVPDGSLTSAGGYDIVLLKYRGSDGAYLWSLRIGGTGQDKAYNIAVDGNGDVIITGYFVGTVDFGGGRLTSAGGSDIYLAKYAGSNGAHVWSRALGGTGSDIGTGLAISVGNSIALTGTFSNSVDFGGGSLTSAGATDLFLAMYSQGGSHLWSRAFGASANDTAAGIATDSTGSPVFTGYFYNSVDFGGGPLAGSTVPSIFLAKYAATNGAHIWSKAFHAPALFFGGSGRAVAIDGDGDIALTGSITDEVDFGGGPLSGPADADIFIAAFSSSGAHRWSKRFVSAFRDEGEGVAFDSGGNVVFGGGYIGTVDFGAGGLAPGLNNAFLARFSSGSASSTPTVPPPVTNTPTLAPTLTRTPTFTPTSVLTATKTPINTGTSTRTPTRTPTNTWTPTTALTATSTRALTNTPSATRTWTPTATSTPTRTPTQTTTPSRTSTPTYTPSKTPTASYTRTPTATSTSSSTPIPTHTTTASPTLTFTKSPTSSPTPIATQTLTSTATRSATAIPTQTATQSATNTPTWTFTATRTPTLDQTDTPTPSPTSGLAVSGQITYYANGSVSAAVNDVAVQLVGGSSSGQAKQTDDFGQFAFTGLDANGYVLSPQKIGDVGNAVSSMDAVYVLQTLGGERTLTPAQQLACDVSGDGTVSAFDAALILQYKVGIIPQFPVAHTCRSDWAFLPEPAQPGTPIQPEIGSDNCLPGAIAIALQPSQGPSQLSNQNFSALAFGDCTGNWQPNGGAGAAALRVAVPGASHVRLGRLVRSRGHLRMPLYVRTGGAHALDLQIRYDATQLGAARVRRMPRTVGALLAVNRRVPGALTVSVASPAPLPSGALLMLEFDATKGGRLGADAVRVDRATVDDK